MAVPALVYGDVVLSDFELGFVEGGQHRRLPLGQGWNRRFEMADPVREFRWAKGGESFAGLYYSTTMGAHVGYQPSPRLDAVPVPRVSLDGYRSKPSGN
ncbi:hypothetical protein [Streptomyces sp. CC224B]|uniref:hypothetical protein n=1 Tax=Streptomyces sp. CC224B TaxID=3044571 RepID=UPI0024A9F29C|nr:hypothetical protein [Streptomyces sp. CC224B]